MTNGTNYLTFHLAKLNKFPYIRIAECSRINNLFNLKRLSSPARRKACLRFFIFMINKTYIKKQVLLFNQTVEDYQKLYEKFSDKNSKVIIDNFTYNYLKGTISYFETTQEDIEIWMPVNGFEGRFEVSNHGRVKSYQTRTIVVKILKPHTDSLGYKVTSLRDKPKHRKVRIHVLVAETFLNKPDIKNICVNHKDGNKLNNHVDNLEWITKKENCQHARDIGLVDTKGSKHPMSKLTEDDVRFIKEYNKNMKGISPQILAFWHNVNPRTIRDILNGVTWKHI